MKRLLGLLLVGLVITGCSSNQTQTSTTNEKITLEEAKEIALNEVSGEVIKTGEDYDDGKMYYEIEIISGDEKYDLEIDSEKGTVAKKHQDLDYIGTAKNQTSTIDESNAGISSDQACQIAQERIGGNGTLIKCELDYDDGVLEYEIEIIKDNIEYDIDVDANSGEITKYEEDR